jgi:hypothetical protein
LVRNVVVGEGQQRDEVDEFRRQCIRWGWRAPLHDP